jgi:hypothetical protein
VTDTRIVLIKPGDVLIIGNLGTALDGEPGSHLLDSLGTLKETLGLAGLAVFAEDIDLAAVRDALPLRADTPDRGHTE